VWLDLDADPPCVGVAGDIDLGSVAPFRQALDQARAANEHHIAVDCRHVTFMGSTGVREIVRIVKQLDRLELRSPSAAVRRVIEMSALDDRVVMTST
jgi:anti-anti-sigma factor